MNPKPAYRVPWLVLLSLLAFAVSGCGGPENSSQTGTGTGTVQLTVVDAPSLIEGIEALTVTFEKVLAHKSGGGRGQNAGWVEIMSAEDPESIPTLDVLQLVNGVNAYLNIATLPAGHYTQIRIIVSEAAIRINGETFPLDIPSGEQTGIKLVQSFNIEPNGFTDLTLDFDAAQSVVRDGNGDYILRPTIRVVETAVTGTISGTVTPLGIGANVWANYHVPDGGAVADVVVASTLSDPETGGYVLNGLLPGDYDLLAAAPGFETGRIAEVTVFANQDIGGQDFALVPSR